MWTPNQVAVTVFAVAVVSYLAGSFFKGMTCQKPAIVSNATFRHIVSEVINQTIPTMLAEYLGRFRNAVSEVVNEPLTDEEQSEWDGHLRRIIREELAAALRRPVEFFPAVANQGEFMKEMVDAIEVEAKERQELKEVSLTKDDLNQMRSAGVDISAVAASMASDAIQDRIGEATAEPREAVEVPLGATGEIRNKLSPTEAAREFGGMVRFGREGIGMSLASMASACSLTVRQMEEVERGEFIPAPGIRDAIVSRINPPWETRDRMCQLYEIAQKPYLGRVET